MINFVNTSWFFVGLVLISFGMQASVWVYFGLYIAYTAIFFRAAFDVSSNFFMPVLCSSPTVAKEIAISFDDGPSEYTPEILRILDQYQVEAAFFCIGKHLADHPTLGQELHRRGHLIGNHTDSHHFWFDCFTTGHMLADMRRMDARVEALIGVRPRLFRPPYGVTLPWLKAAVDAGGYEAIGWSVRSLDTIINDEQKLLNKVVAALEPGAIFLFHDTRKITAAILAQFLEQATLQGYRVVRVDKLLNLEPYVPVLVNRF